MIDVPYELPKGWEWVRLINITSRIHYGYTASALTEGDAKLLRITDIQKNRVNWESVPYCNISNTKLDDMQLINGDIVIARTGGTLGKSFHIMDLTDVAVFASYLIRLQSVDIKNSFFNKRFLESFEYWKQLDKISGGTGQPNVNATNLGLLLIPVPPEKEQSRILNKIYNLFEDVNLIDSEQQYLTNLSEQLKQKVLDIAMQGKLVPQDPNDEPASVLLEKIRAEKQRLFEEGKLKKKDLVETEIVKGDDNAYYENLPKNWLIQSISSVGDIRTGNTPSKSHSEYYNGEFPFFKPTDLSQGIDLRYSSETLTSLGFVKSRHLPKGSVLVNSIGNIGTVALLSVDGAFNQQINGIYPYSFVDSRFLFWLLGTTIVQEQMIEKASATTIAIINKTKFNSIQIAFPSILLQRTIADTIGKIVLVLNSLL